MKKRRCVWAAFCALAVFCLVLPGAAAAAPFGKDEMKRMSVFLGNFTELEFYELDLEEEGDGTLHLGGPDAAPDLIRFGIGHNYINNFKSRVKKCAEKDCEHGSLTIEGKFVQESVKKYFDLELENRSVMNSDPPYFFDGRLYHFEGADGEAVYYAEVKTASREGGVIRMSGELYNAEDRKDRPATFQAVAKPYKWNGKDTWAILSIRSEFE